MPVARLRFQDKPPAKAPKRLRDLYFEATGVRQLQVKISGKSGVEAFGFSYAGTPVLMSQNQGVFNAKIGRKALLEWVMVGQPGGSMKVTVSDGSIVVAERVKSEILPPYAEGYDALEILV